MLLNKKMILAIETSCDETAVAILENGKNLLANVVSSQIDFHKEFGGVIPELASRLHIEKITLVIEKALKDAKVNYKDITLIAVTKGPGLIGALHVGIQAAKALSISYDIPIVGINHIAGHIYANSYVAELKFPSLALVVSGGHTEIVYIKKKNVFKIVGETLDDAVGEAYDKVSRVLGLGYPGGPIIDKLASKGAYDYHLPYPKANGKYNFSYSGLKTAVINLVNSLNQKKEAFKKEDIAFSFQKVAISMLVDKTSKVLHDKKEIKQLILGGGVSANSHLRSQITKKIKDEHPNVELIIPPLWCCTDNAAMIAMAAFWGKEKKEEISFGANPNLNI